jgi:predicted lipid-binding transport protein (Tim44 family)
VAGLLGSLLVLVLELPASNGVVVAVAVGVFVFVGFTFGFTFGILLWLLNDVWNLPLAAAADVTPRAVYRRDMQTRLLSGLLFGLVAGLLAGLTAALIVFGIELTGISVRESLADALTDALTVGLVFGLIAGPVAGLIGGLRHPAAPLLHCTEIAFLLRGRAVRFIPLLDAARERQVLRQAGAVYQFRHADLQDRLAYRHRREHA